MKNFVGKHALKVTFADPRAGWLGLEIITPQGEFREVVSYTPNDFPLELSAALSLVLQGMDATATASCEPITYELTFCPSPHLDLLHFQITKYPDSKRNRADGVAVLCVKAGVRDVVLPFWLALRGLEGRISVDTYLDAFHREFPTACLQRLSHQVGQY
jgi:hypothetical protein